jgi:hypothetical protein
MTRASSGLVRNPTGAGIRAARHRSGSSAQRSGRYSSRSIIARPLELARPRTRQAGSCRPSRPCRSTGAGPHRGRPLLEEPGLVHHQHGIHLAQVLQHIGAQVITDRVGVPVGRGQQPLHPVWGPLAGVLGQLPAVLPPHVTQQPAQVGQRPPARLRPGEPSRDPGVQGIQPERGVMAQEANSLERQRLLIGGVLAVAILQHHRGQLGDPECRTPTRRTRGAAHNSCLPGLEAPSAVLSLALPLPFGT